MYLKTSEDKATSAPAAIATGLPLSNDSLIVQALPYDHLSVQLIFHIILPFSFGGTLCHFPESKHFLAAETAKSMSFLSPAAQVDIFFFR